MKMTITPIFFDVKMSNTHEVPTTIIRVGNLIAKKDAEYPGGPARNVCNGAQLRTEPETPEVRLGTLQPYG